MIGRSSKPMSSIVNPAKSLNSAEFYHLIRGHIESEDSLVNQRVNWLIFSQSFLFSTFVALIDPSAELKNIFHVHLQSELLWLIPCLSLVCSLLIYLSILSSLAYIADLRSQFHNYPQDGTANNFPPIQSTIFIRQVAQLTPILVPLLFMGTWTFLLVQELY